MYMLVMCYIFSLVVILGCVENEIFIVFFLCLLVLRVYYGFIIEGKVCEYLD